MDRRSFLISSAATATAGPQSLVLSSSLVSGTAPVAGEPGVAVLLIDTDRVSAPIDEKIYGHFLEHINHSVVDGRKVLWIFKLTALRLDSRHPLWL